MGLNSLAFNGEKTGSASRPKVIASKKYFPAERLRRNLRTRGQNERRRGLWRRVASTLRWSGGLALGLCLVCGLSLALVSAYRKITGNGYFALKNIEITGNRHLRQEDILTLLQLKTGMNIFSFSIRDMEHLLAGRGWVRSLSIQREAAEGVIRIRILEHEPKYWTRRPDGSLNYADERGLYIAPVEAGNMAALPLLEMEPGTENTAARLPELLESLTGLGFPLSVRNAAQIRLTEAGTMEITLHKGQRLIVGLNNWERNILHMLKVIEDLSRRGELKHMLEIRAHGRDVWVSLQQKPA
ncbi:MAG: FtsQ-type POTRA domain-containing protein [Deltaproteobacteria bacterium]|jgi:cell division protein FtsQ|nr:FtsQ-type POTRA domain-containing protein [Deltaproteobacteria bacterium]